MKMRNLLTVAALWAGSGSICSAQGGDAQQPDLRPGEKMVAVPMEPYQWRKDPRCYISRTAFDPNNVLQPQPQALKWRKYRQFSGYLYTNFEGWTFSIAQRNEDPRKLGDDRYYASAYYVGKEIAFAPEPRTYWVTFLGREALCNSQRPDELHFDAPFSPNLVIIDRVKALIRVR